MEEYHVIRTQGIREKMAEFCVMWLSVMDGNYDRLVSLFHERGWNYSDFKQLATSEKWWVKSMDILGE